MWTPDLALSVCPRQPILIHKKIKIKLLVCDEANLYLVKVLAYIIGKAFVGLDFHAVKNYILVILVYP